ncbi:hypothetical protein [Stenomitos frigidus]|uniref:Uncharacterized protein n=1 Tax=Stenomitos frigidus ULC18 TaxID=2107698 RepID=A0A2T1DSI5_9CYAN|nr:hypothetical protein [Stenomitos frigidus]PSB23476.1 hypothetical protein C7B82_31035 [Stenomitos frigidus ULC18]
MLIEMKLPKNRQSRLADDVWIAGEAIARHFRMSSARDGFEIAVRDYAIKMSERDPQFYQLWEQVKNEGIDGTTLTEDN